MDNGQHSCPASAALLRSWWAFMSSLNDHFPNPKWSEQRVPMVEGCMKTSTRLWQKQPRAQKFCSPCVPAGIWARFLSVRNLQSQPLIAPAKKLGLMDGRMDVNPFISMLYWLIHGLDSNFGGEEVVSDATRADLERFGPLVVSRLV